MLYTEYEITIVFNYGIFFRNIYKHLHMYLYAIRMYSSIYFVSPIC